MCPTFSTVRLLAHLLSVLILLDHFFFWFLNYIKILSIIKKKFPKRTHSEKIVSHESQTISSEAKRIRHNPDSEQAARSLKLSALNSHHLPPISPNLRRKSITTTHGKNSTNLIKTTTPQSNVNASSNNKAISSQQVYYSPQLNQLAVPERTESPISSFKPQSNDHFVLSQSVRLDENSKISSKNPIRKKNIITELNARRRNSCTSSILYLSDSRNRNLISELDPCTLSTYGSFINHIDSNSTAYKI